LAILIIINAEIAEWITHINIRKLMKRYRISVWACIEVEAKDLEDALDQAHDAVIGCDIKTNEFEFEAEEID
jgi:hypothetical protein